MDSRPAPIPLVYHGPTGAASENEARPIIVARRMSVHAVCVGVYRTHCDAGTGLCAACGQPSPCRARRHAAVVIEAYADVPGRYDTGSAPADARRVPVTAGVSSG